MYYIRLCDLASFILTNYSKINIFPLTGLVLLQSQLVDIKDLIMNKQHNSLNDFPGLKVEDIYNSSDDGKC